MYITSGTSTLLRRAWASNSSSSSCSGKRVFSSLSGKAGSGFGSASPSPPPCAGGYSRSVGRQQHRSLSYLTPSRWSHGVDWKSPASLAAQIRIASGYSSNLLSRKIATMGLSENLLFIEMSFTRGIKHPVEILYKRLNSPAKWANSYSTSTTCNEISVSRFSECNAAGFLKDYRPINSFGICFTRTYSSETSASEQMNLIKQLRERTSAPIKEVKSALVACNWDVEAAQKELRKRGVVLASKKSSQIAAEGLLALAQNEMKAVVVELNCETDFVARNDIFQHLALSLAKSALLLESSAHAHVAIPVSPKCLWDMKVNFDHPKITGERTVENAIVEVAAMMGENVKLGGGFILTAPSHGVLSTYLHTSPQPGLGRIAGLLSLEVEDKNASLDAIRRVGSEIAMHIVAAKPLFLSTECVTGDALANERDILRAQAESTGKPQMAIDKMVEGRMRKYFEEVVLLEQKFIVDDTINIKTLLNNLSKEVGSTVKIGNFLRVEVGEGLKRIEAASGMEPLPQAA